VALPTQGNIHNCFSGNQLCSGGAWSACQELAALVGARTQSFVASCPAGSGLSWTTLDYVVDAPANASGVAGVTVVVAGHPEIVLLDTQSGNASSVEKIAGSVSVAPLLGALVEQSEMALQITTTTTPDGAMAATAQATLSYDCGAQAAK
jgi:hypothetical protein